jgi:DNA sulfur modification protein DndB
MGDWIYYAAFLKISDIAQRVSLADEIHKHQGLRDMIQRSLDESGHAESIKQYLLTKPQRFFNALVIGVYGGAPNFFEVELHRGPQLGPEELPEYFKGALGVLQFNGAEQLFAIDGQHRVVGIKKAVEQSDTLGDEEVIALFVHHSRDAAGMERSRRLFTTLNRYAKPVSKMDIIALDEDDIVAIVTRMLVEEYPLFKNFLKIKKGKALPARDAESFTTIETLYDALDTFLADQDPWTEFKRSRPSDSKVKQSPFSSRWAALDRRRHSNLHGAGRASWRYCREIGRGANGPPARSVAGTVVGRRQSTNDHSARESKSCDADSLLRDRRRSEAARDVAT